MSAASFDWVGFRGIAPDGLRGLADACRDKARLLVELGREAAVVSVPWQDATVGWSGHHAERLAGEVQRWGTELLDRAATIERGQRAASRLAMETIRGVVATSSRFVIGPACDGEVDAAIDAIRSWLSEGWIDWDVTGNDLRNMAGMLVALDRSQRRAVMAALGTERAVRWLAELLRERMDETDRDAHLRLVVSAMDVDDLVPVLETMLDASRSSAAIAALGDAVAAVTPPEDVVSLVDALVPRIDAGRWLPALLVGHAVAAADGGPHISEVTELLLAGSGRLGAVLRASSHDWRDGSQARPVDRIVDHLAAIDDPSVGAAVVLELMHELTRRLDDDWKRDLDRAIVTIIEAAPAGILNQLGDRLDPAGETVVPWVRRLFEVGGSSEIGRLAGGLLGPAPVDPYWFADTGAGATFENARAAGYLAGALIVATKLEADGGHDRIADYGFLSGVAEVATSAAAGVAALAEAVVPLALDLGVEGWSRSADEKIDDAMWWLLEQIDERFEPAAGADVPDLGDALLAFDERRDQLVDARLGR